MLAVFFGADGQVAYTHRVASERLDQGLVAQLTKPMAAVGAEPYRFPACGLNVEAVRTGVAAMQCTLAREDGAQLLRTLLLLDASAPSELVFLLLPLSRTIQSGAPDSIAARSIKDRPVALVVTSEEHGAVNGVARRLPLALLEAFRRVVASRIGPQSQ